MLQPALFGGRVESERGQKHRATCLSALISSAALTEPELAQWKHDFPAQFHGSVQVSIADRRDHDGHAVKRHMDTIEITAPSDDVWSWYAGMVRTTTVQALPRTLELIEERVGQDSERMAKISNGASERAVAARTQDWLNKVLHPYLNQAKRR